VILFVASGECPLRAARRLQVHPAGSAWLFSQGARELVTRGSVSAGRAGERFPDDRASVAERVPFCGAAAVRSAAGPAGRNSKSLGFNGVPGACSSRGAEVCSVCSAGCTAVPLCLGFASWAAGVALGGFNPF